MVDTSTAGGATVIPIDPPPNEPSTNKGGCTYPEQRKPARSVMKGIYTHPSGPNRGRREVIEVLKMYDKSNGGGGFAIHVPR